MSVVAKFNVYSVESFTHGAKVVLQPVYAPPGSDARVTDPEDGAFWQATPSGRIEMNINNDAAAEQFQPGNVFYVTFDRVTPSSPTGAGTE